MQGKVTTGARIASDVRGVDRLGKRPMIGVDVGAAFADEKVTTGGKTARRAPDAALLGRVPTNGATIVKTAQSVVPTATTFTHGTAAPAECAGHALING